MLIKKPCAIVVRNGLSFAQRSGQDVVMMTACGYSKLLNFIFCVILNQAVSGSHHQHLIVENSIFILFYTMCIELKIYTYQLYE